MNSLERYESLMQRWKELRDSYDSSQSSFNEMMVRVSKIKTLKLDFEEFTDTLEGKASKDVDDWLVLGRLYISRFKQKIKHDKAQASFLEAAKLGSIEAMVKVAIRLRNLNDTVEAERWYREAAELGNISSMESLSSLLLEKKTVESFEEAITWLKLAVSKGSVFAMLRIGSAYKRSYGVPADLEKALKWHLKAIEHGGNYHESVGDLYRDHIKDLNKALEWYLKVDEEKKFILFKIGDLYMNRSADFFNPSKAIEYYTRYVDAATDHSFMKAPIMLRMAKVYLGAGVDDNGLQKAKEWLQLVIANAKPRQSCHKEAKKLIAKFEDSLL